MAIRTIPVNPDTIAVLRQLRAKKELETGERVGLGQIADEVLKNYGSVVIATRPTILASKG